MNAFSDNFETRIVESVSFAWDIFSQKVALGSIEINKEASMQLHYAHLLQTIIPLICYSKNQSVIVELETAIKLGENETKEADITLVGKNSNKQYKLAIELKCYKEFSSSGKKRGATNNFMKDVYEDLSLLERYCDVAGYDHGVALVMTDLERLTLPVKKSDSKCKEFDISNCEENETRGSRLFSASVKGKAVNFELKNQYHFQWKPLSDGSKNKFWFLKNEKVII